MDAATGKGLEAQEVGTLEASRSSSQGSFPRIISFPTRISSGCRSYAGLSRVSKRSMPQVCRPCHVSCVPTSLLPSIFSFVVGPRALHQWHVSGGECARCGHEPQEVVTPEHLAARSVDALGGLQSLDSSGMCLGGEQMMTHPWCP
jgi:hypothetical protein